MSWYWMPFTSVTEVPFCSGHVIAGLRVGVLPSELVLEISAEDCTGVGKTIGDDKDGSISRELDMASESGEEEG